MTVKFEFRRGSTTPKVAMLLTLLVAWAAGAMGQRPAPYITTALAIRAGADLQGSWKVEQAEVEENFLTVSFLITLKNVSGKPVPSAYFFGKYYDGSGRLCFTALFSLGNNREGRAGPAMPGETRTLRSVSFLVPAVKARVLELYPSNQVRVPSDSPVPAALAAPLTPVMVRMASVPSNGNRLCFGGEPEVPDRPVIDVALAKARITADGKMRSLDVLDALATRPFVAWFTQLASHLTFLPASRKGRPFASEVLLLARVLARGWNPAEPPLLARSNPWVKTAIQDLAGSQVPPILPIMLYNYPSEPFAERRHPEKGPCFEYGGGGTAWSAGFPYLVPLIPSAAH